MTYWNKVATATHVMRYVWAHPANQKRKIQSEIRAVTWQVNKLLNKYWDLEVFGSLKLRCYPDSAWSGFAMYSNGYSDYHEMNFMQHYLQPGDNFLDVGANIGIYTLLAASIVGKAGQIDAFEPGLRALEILRENIANNSLDQVNVYPVAVGKVPGNVSFIINQDTTNRIQAINDVEKLVMEVPCVRLDDALNGRKYAMGKMDIEGAELLALQGAESLLSDANPPVWLLEMKHSEDYGFTDQELCDFLAKYGYELAIYNADNRELHWDKQPWKQNDNVLAIARTEKDAVIKKINQNYVVK